VQKEPKKQNYRFLGWPKIRGNGSTKSGHILTQLGSLYSLVLEVDLRGHMKSQWLCIHFIGNLTSWK